MEAHYKFPLLENKVAIKKNGISTSLLMKRGTGRGKGAKDKGGGERKDERGG